MSRSSSSKSKERYFASPSESSSSRRSKDKESSSGSSRSGKSEGSSGSSRSKSGSSSRSGKSRSGKSGRSKKLDKAVQPLITVFIVLFAIASLLIVYSLFLRDLFDGPLSPMQKANLDEVIQAENREKLQALESAPPKPVESSPVDPDADTRSSVGYAVAKTQLLNAKTSVEPLPGAKPGGKTPSGAKTTATPARDPAYQLPDRFLIQVIAQQSVALKAEDPVAVTFDSEVEVWLDEVLGRAIVAGAVKGFSKTDDPRKRRFWAVGFVVKPNALEKLRTAYGNALMDGVSVCRITVDKAALVSLPWSRGEDVWNEVETAFRSRLEPKLKSAD